MQGPGRGFHIASAAEAFREPASPGPLDDTGPLDPARLQAGRPRRGGREARGDQHLDSARRPL